MKRTAEMTLLQDEYGQIIHKYSSFCTEIVRQLDNLITKSEIKVAVPIQSRIKKWDSIESKLTQRRFNVKRSITELQDLAGLRIILLFKRDVERVTTLIKDNMVIIREYDTSIRMAESEFGYSSIHIIGKLKKEWLQVPTLSQYLDMIFEVQVRTLSQHNWAEASNIFQYKHEGAVPKPLRRSISRISALLEIVDLEFERLIIEREEFKEDPTTETNEEGESILNVDALEKFLDKNLPPSNKARDEDYGELLEDLKIFELNTVEKLNTLFENSKEESLNEERRIVAEQGGDIEDPERLEKSVFFTHTGLVRTMFNSYFKRPWYEVKAEKLGVEWYDLIGNEE